MSNELNLVSLLPQVQATVREASRLMMDREHLLVKTKGSVTNLCTITTNTTTMRAKPKNTASAPTCTSVAALST